VCVCVCVCVRAAVWPCARNGGLQPARVTPGRARARSFAWIADFGAEREDATAAPLPQLVGNYLKEGYGSMTQDSVRNRRYALAVAALAGARPNGAHVRRGAALAGADRWLEIGPGANAVLTQYVLAAGARVVSVEGNAAPAASARLTVKEHGAAARVLHGMSTDAGIVAALREEIAASGEFKAIVHELLGFFAGSEANVHVWNELRAAGIINAGVKSVPRRAGTFICPVLAEAHDFNVCYSSPVYIVHNAFTLARHFKIGDAQVRSGGGGPDWRSQLFERLEFDGGADIERVQRCALRFAPDRPAWTNGLVCWLWADVGDAPHGTAKRAAPTGYPWGDRTAPVRGERALMFSSRMNDGLDATGACCLNWRNVFLPLPEVLSLDRGDVLTVNTTAYLGGPKARYEFEVRLGDRLVRRIDLANPYPVFTQHRGRFMEPEVQPR
jgi:hypothetical protein